MQIAAHFEFPPPELRSRLFGLHVQALLVLLVLAWQQPTTSGWLLHQSRQPGRSSLSPPGLTLPPPPHSSALTNSSQQRALRKSNTSSSGRMSRRRDPESACAASILGGRCFGT